MIEIGEALKEIFKDITIGGIAVTTHYGDQKELNAWVLSHKSTQTFPLIWYVLNKTTPISKDEFEVNSQLILFALSDVNMMNSERYNKNYKTYLTPLYNEVNKVLSKNKFVNIKENRFGLPFADEPNYGIKDMDLNFQGLNQKSNQKGITIQVVDARIIFLNNLGIRPNCIIK